MNVRSVGAPRVEREVRLVHAGLQAGLCELDFDTHEVGGSSTSRAHQPIIEVRASALQGRLDGACRVHLGAEVAQREPEYSERCDDVGQRRTPAGVIDAEGCG